MEFDRPLAAGATGGHGPVRYTVATHTPSQWVRFTFSGPRGFHGFHEYAVFTADEDHTLLRHTRAVEAVADEIEPTRARVVARYGPDVVPQPRRA